MNLLYIEPGGRVRSGLLAPSAPNEDQRNLLWRAVRAGYSVESA